MHKLINKTAEIFNHYKKYFSELIVLAFPILIGNLGHTLIGATDILVVAKYNINSLAAISISNAILFTEFIFGLGILTAISIVISNMRGSRQVTKKYLLSGLIFSFILAFIFTLICYSTRYFVPYCGFEDNLVPKIMEYIAIVSFSIFGMYFYDGIKQFLQAYEIVKFPNMILLGAVLVNLILDVVFVFGFGVIPAMGSKGAAIATLTVRTLMGLIMFVYVFKMINFKSKIDLKYMKQLLKVGTPIGFALLLEFLAFNIITILVGREKGLLSATHNILITISSATFMIPLSISTALAVKVAYYYGAKKCMEIKNFSYSGLILGVGFMAIAGIILALFPKQIISLFTDNKDVYSIALPIISIAAMYQVFDGFQVVTGGILKGFKMTKFVSNSILIGYWLVGMPVAVVLAGKYHLSLRGYWIALAVSLCVIGFVQAAIARYKFKKLKEMYK